MKYTKLNYFVSQSSQQKESGPAEIRVEKKDATTRMKEKVVAGVDGGPRSWRQPLIHALWKQHLSI